MSDFEENAARRSAALALLEDREDEIEQGDGEEETFGADDLDVAAQIKNRLPYADELTHKAAIRKNQWRTLNDEAPFARSNPPSVLKGTLGGQQIVSSDPNVTGNNNAQVALWGGDDAETTAVTVTFAPVQQIVNASPSGMAPGAFRPYGIVKFGTRGFLVEVEVDILKGQQFTVGASYISVQVAMEKINPALGPGASMKLAGMLSFLTTQHTTPVTRTKYVDNLASDKAIYVDIPPFAKQFIVWRADPALATFVQVVDANQSPLYGFPIAANAVMTVPVQLSGDAIQLLVYNADLNLPNNFRVIFDLNV